MRFYTSRYQNPRVKAAALAKEVLAVGVTLYPPRFPLGYPLFARLQSMAPSHALFHIDDAEVFKPLFLELLEYRSSEIKLELGALERSCNGLPVVLLCFEKLAGPSDWCHRQFLAEWLEINYGGVIEEFPS